MSPICKDVSFSHERDKTHPNFWATSTELTTSGCVIMTNSWLQTLLRIIQKAETKISWKKKKVCENKETDSPSGVYRMKLPGTCSLLKESHENKWDSYFGGVGLLLFGWDSYFFLKRESRTPNFKILVRTLASMGAMAALDSFKTRPWISSGPLALCGLIFPRSFLTPFT